VFVEMINLRIRHPAQPPVQLRAPYVDGETEGPPAAS
jgi:hypothetical protein